ncbi:MAG: cytochrome c3 family protein, partial [Phycisphaerales bacterium]|nr:cytochrome c3 family protein [Phycisphaerales bacterium]
TFSSRLNPLGAPGETRERAWGALCVAILIAWSGTSAVADSIVNSRHNLSASGPGPVRASTETEVCIFCHTPHGASGEAPLWNRTSSGANYTTYLSSTTKAAIGQPTGSSRLCLSCHDGTIALGMVQSRTEPIPMSGGITTMPNGHPAHLGTDLSDDHPISFAYSSSLAAANGQLRDPSALSGRVRLENGQLQCTTCHDPHDDANGSFLVMPNTASALCLECHAPNQWAGSSHATSSRTWNGST